MPSIDEAFKRYDMVKAATIVRDTTSQADQRKLSDETMHFVVDKMIEDMEEFNKTLEHVLPDDDPYREDWGH